MSVDDTPIPVPPMEAMPLATWPSAMPPESPISEPPPPPQASKNAVSASPPEVPQGPGTTIPSQLSSSAVADISAASAACPSSVAGDRASAPASEDKLSQIPQPASFKLAPDSVPSPQPPAVSHGAQNPSLGGKLQASTARPQASPPSGHMPASPST